MKTDYGRRARGLVCRRGFSMIEILVVVVVMGVLLSMMIPTLKTIKAKQRVAEAKGDTMRIVSGWKRYMSTYKVWPNFAQETADFDGNANLMDSEYVDLLTATDTDANLLSGRFLEVHPDSLDADGAMVDPWGNPYRVLFDVNFDNQIVNAATTVVDTVISWSEGPDPDDVSDNVNSWD